MKANAQYIFPLLLILSSVLMSCQGSKELTEQDFKKSSVKASVIAAKIPDYRSKIQTIRGKGRAIVSEPGNTERLRLLFSSNRSKSLVTIRNGIGIEGGQLLTDGDTLLVYNKVDKYARKIPVLGGKLNNINKLASLNILAMTSYPVPPKKVSSIYENGKTYKLLLESGTEIFVNKKSNLIRQVIQPASSQLPYSKIIYDAYSTMEGFKLPRRISIFGSESKSKIALQLTDLELNATLDSLTINLPDDIPVYYK